MAESVTSALERVRAARKLLRASHRTLIKDGHWVYIETAEEHLAAAEADLAREEKEKIQLLVDLGRSPFTHMSTSSSDPKLIAEMEASDRRAAARRSAK
jgi:hypothetical protein